MSASFRGVPMPSDGLRRSTSRCTAWMSIASPGGTPSSTQPTASPWDDPNNGDLERVADGIHLFYLHGCPKLEQVLHKTGIGYLEAIAVIDVRLAFRDQLRPLRRPSGCGDRRAVLREHPSIRRTVDDAAVLPFLDTCPHVSQELHRGRDPVALLEPDVLGVEDGADPLGLGGDHCDDRE